MACSAQRDRATPCVSKCVLCYDSPAMGVINVLNGKSDLQGHSRALAMVPFDRQHTISLVFLLVLYCNYVSILHHFRDIITHFQKFKEIT